MQPIDHAIHSMAVTVIEYYDFHSRCYWYGTYGNNLIITAVYHPVDIGYVECVVIRGIYEDCLRRERVS